MGINTMHEKIDTLHESISPEGIAVYLKPAGPAIRFVAWVIDSSIELAITTGGYIVLSIAAGFTGTWVLLLFMFAISWFYRVLFELLWQGQSPGKRIMGLRVVRPDGSPVDAPASFMRNLLRFADSFMGLHLVALLVMASDPAFRRLGDIAAGTLVVYTGNADVLYSRLGSTDPTLLDQHPPLSPLGLEERKTVLDAACRHSVLGDELLRELCGRWVEETCGTTVAEPQNWLLALAERLAGRGKRS